MPRKSKKAKEEVQIPQLEFELFFSDVTILEASGNYNKVKEIMKSDGFCPDVWNIKSNLLISSQFGDGDFVLDFKNDGSIYIVNYVGHRDVFMNHDIGCLMRWSQENGWKIPQPIESLAKDNLYFWKKMWEMRLINSDYFDSRFGSRALYFDEELDGSGDE